LSPFLLSTFDFGLWTLDSGLWTLDFLFHINRLDVHKFFDAIRAELAAVARFLDAAERQPRIGRDERVDERAPGLELAREALASRGVPGEHRGPKPEDAVVGDTHRVCFVARGEYRRDGSE